MDICNDCSLLSGQPSSIAPHASLVHRAVVHLGAGADRQKMGTIWLCVDCGSTMRQSTRHDREFPGVWNFGMDG